MFLLETMHVPAWSATRLQTTCPSWNDTRALRDDTLSTAGRKQAYVRPPTNKNQSTIGSSVAATPCQAARLSFSSCQGEPDNPLQHVSSDPSDSDTRSPAVTPCQAGSQDKQEAPNENWPAQPPASYSPTDQSARSPAVTPCQAGS